MSDAARSEPYDPTERPNYFYGQLLDVADLQAEQDYHRDKLRLHNRMLHGWGIVEGLFVTPGASTGEIQIAPGMALDPTGNEISVCDAVTADVAAPLAGSPQVFVAIRYTEELVKPLPPLVGAEPDDVQYSRIRDSYEVAVLTEAPATGADGWLVLAAVSHRRGTRSADLAISDDERRLLSR